MIERGVEKRSDTRVKTEGQRKNRVFTPFSSQIIQVRVFGFEMGVVIGRRTGRDAVLIQSTEGKVVAPAYQNCCLALLHPLCLYKKAVFESCRFRIPTPLPVPMAVFDDGIGQRVSRRNTSFSSNEDTKTFLQEKDCHCNRGHPKERTQSLLQARLTSARKGLQPGVLFRAHSFRIRSVCVPFRSGPFRFRSLVPFRSVRHRRSPTWSTSTRWRYTSRRAFRRPSVRRCRAGSRTPLRCSCTVSPFLTSLQLSSIVRLKRPKACGSC